MTQKEIKNEDHGKASLPCDGKSEYFVDFHKLESLFCRNYLSISHFVSKCSCTF